jgi:hypothetical protein
MPTDAAGLVAALITTGESCGIELACLPHLRAVAEERVTGKPSELVDPFMHEAWRPSLTGVLALVPMLTRDAIVQADGPRLFGAILVLLEAMTQTDEDAYENAKAILNDTRELGAVLLAMKAARRARIEAQIAANAALPVDPALVAELATIDHVVVEELELSLPLPVRAEQQTQSDAKTVTFLVVGDRPHLNALYRAWAPGAGWLLEMVLDNERYSAFELTREGVVIGVRLTHWIDGRIMLSIELPRPLTATAVVRQASMIVGPTLPPITRERLPALPSGETSLEQPGALLADGGLLFLAAGYDVWMIDPHARTKDLVASTNGVRMRGLVADGAGLLGMSSAVTLYGIGGTAVPPVVVNDLAFGVSLCRIGSTAFVACDDGQILAARLPTGEVLARIAGFTKDLRALTRADATLYAVDARVISSIDPATYDVTRIFELPTAAVSIASDGDRIYTLHSRAIGCVDLATRSFTQLAGRPQLGARQMLDASGGAARDGIAESAVIEAPRFLSYEAGSLWFTDDGRLRHFEIATRRTTTLELA